MSIIAVGLKRPCVLGAEHCPGHTASVVTTAGSLAGEWQPPELEQETLTLYETPGCKPSTLHSASRPW